MTMTKQLLHLNSVLSRTDEGTAKMRARSADLAPKLRAVLFLVDGQRTVSQLLDRAGGLRGLLLSQLEELSTRGLVREHLQEASTDGEATLRSAQHATAPASDLPPIVAAKMQLLLRLEALQCKDTDLLGAELIESKTLMDLATNAKLVSLALEAQIGPERAAVWWSDAKQILVAWRDLSSNNSQP